jgi:hypothetical protein
MRLDTDRQKELEPKRMQYARNQITALGYEITEENATALKFVFKGATVTLFPYSGWHTGKTIQDGRGIGKLLKQIRPNGKRNY